MTNPNNPSKKRNKSINSAAYSINASLMTLGTWICKRLSLIRLKKSKKNFKSYLHCRKYKSITPSLIKKYPILIFLKSIKNIPGLISLSHQSLKDHKCGKNSSSTFKILTLKHTINMIWKLKKFMNWRKMKWKFHSRNKSVIFGLF